MQFERQYYRGLKYTSREQLIKRYVLEIIKWGSTVSNQDLLDGRGKKALDVGCAFGYATSLLGSLGYETYGVDISRYGTRQARIKCAGNLLVCDAQTNLPFQDKVFDLITCLDVLEHLRYPLKAVKNMFDLSKNVMIYATPNKAVERPIRKIVKDCDETHVNVKLPSEWEKSIRTNLNHEFVKVETFLDFNLRVADKLLFFKSIKIPHLGLTARILVKK